MKKALQITLAGNLFTIEEDAYNTLHSYLTSIKEYFTHITDSDDVVEDIEARIAEQLLEKIKHHNNIVTLTDVDHVMESMGTIEEISGTSTTEPTKTNTAEESTPTRRLYRSADDVVIAGVASGVASYFGVDTFAMRIVFVLALMATGGGFIFVYIAAALLIPQAKTATDKVKMKGGPVTLASFKDTFNEQMDAVKVNSSSLRQTVEKMFYMIGNIIRTIVKVIVKIIGAFLVVGAAFASFVQIFIAGNLLFNYNSPYIDFPLTQVISQPIYYLLILIAFLTVFIPTLFVGSLGIMILSRKSRISNTTAMILGGIWIIAVILAGTLGFRTGLDVQQKIKSLPEYQSATQTLEQSPFTGIELHGRHEVTYVESDIYKVTVQGRQIDIDKALIIVENNILKIDTAPRKDFCLICMDGERLQIEVAAPSMNSVFIDDVGHFKSSNLDAENISITIKDAGSAHIGVNAKILHVDVEQAGRLRMHGTSTDVTLLLEDAARFDGDELAMTNVTATLKDGGRAHIEATGSIQITAADGARATYVGTNPNITIEDGARVENVSSSTKRAVDLSNSY
ncbi:MAG: DUF2807 domain-containing protein [Patescibacteria group bacterium]